MDLATPSSSHGVFGKQPVALQEAYAVFGKLSASFYDLQRAMRACGQQLILVQSQAEALHLFDSAAIKTMVVKLDRDAAQTRLMIAEIRRLRPTFKVVEGGTPLVEVIKDNFACFAQGLDGTVKFQQFSEAFEKTRAWRRKLIYALCSVPFGILTILICAAVLPSPLAKFFGAFWSTILIVEFGYVVFLYWRRLDRATRWLPDSFRQ